MNESAPRVAAVQMNSGADVHENLATAARLLARAAADGAVLAVLPENFALMGRHESDKLAVAEAPGNGPIQRFLSSAAREHSMWLLAGTVPLRTAEPSRVAAASLLYDASGACVARYDKIHLFDVEVAAGESYRESASIAAGAAKPVVARTPAGPLGLSVCYDLRFPELYRALVAQGAELLAVPSAFTENTGQAHWDVLLRARAIENQCYVVAAAQSGDHPSGRRTWGHAMIVDPWGRVLSRVEQGEGLAVAGVPADALKNLRARFPVLEHRRL